MKRPEFCFAQTIGGSERAAMIDADFEMRAFRIAAEVPARGNPRAARNARPESFRGVWPSPGKCFCRMEYRKINQSCLRGRVESVRKGAVLLSCWQTNRICELTKFQDG